MGDQGQSRRPAPVFSIFDNVGSHVPTAVREKIWAEGYVDLEILLKKSQDLRSYPNSTWELVIKNGHLVVEKQQSKPINNTHVDICIYCFHVCIPREIPWQISGADKIHDIRLAASRQGHVGWAKYGEEGAVPYIIMGGG